MGTYCAPLTSVLFLFCYENDLMMFLSDDTHADIIEAFNATLRYLDDLLNIDNSYLKGIVTLMYPTVLQWNKANATDTETAFVRLALSLSNGFVSSKIFDKRDDLDFDFVNFLFFRWRRSSCSFLRCLHF